MIQETADCLSGNSSMSTWKQLKVYLETAQCLSGSNTLSTWKQSFVYLETNLFLIGNISSHIYRHAFWGQWVGVGTCVITRCVSFYTHCYLCFFSSLLKGDGPFDGYQLFVSAYKNGIRTKTSLCTARARKLLSTNFFTVVLSYRIHQPYWGSA